MLLALSWVSAPARAQGGPPFLTNDPGTPGAGNWEINLGAAATHASGTGSYQLPQLDVNFGLGDRVQLTVEAPYVLQYSSGASAQEGWSNVFLGVKWRFLDQGEEGWQASVFPQFETAGSRLAQRNGIAIAGPRLLLPVELVHKVGPLDVNVEAGYYLPRNGYSERFLGVALGRELSPRLELDGEIYADKASGAPPDDTIADVGLRYKLHPAFILLGLAGRSIAGTGGEHAQFVGYLGVQILLSDYGAHLHRDGAP